jgi:hypothetical protein
MFAGSCDTALKSRPGSLRIICGREFLITTATDAGKELKMWNKPFKPPLLKNVSKPPLQQEQCESLSPPRPAKKRKLLIHIVDDEELSPRTPIVHSSAVNAARKPLISIKNPVTAAQAVAPASSGHEGYYIVLW